MIVFVVINESLWEHFKLNFRCDCNQAVRFTDNKLLQYVACTILHLQVVTSKDYWIQNDSLYLVNTCMSILFVQVLDSRI
jgi:hypothetical protein